MKPVSGFLFLMRSLFPYMSGLYNLKESPAQMQTPALQMSVCLWINSTFISWTVLWSLPRTSLPHCSGDFFQSIFTWITHPSPATCCYLCSLLLTNYLLSLALAASPWICGSFCCSKAVRPFLLEMAWTIGRAESVLKSAWLGQCCCSCFMSTPFIRQGSRSPLALVSWQFSEEVFSFPQMLLGSLSRCCQFWTRMGFEP